MRLHYSLLALMASTALFGACEKKPATEPEPDPAAGKLALHVENVAGSRSLALGTNYTTAAGDDFKVTELKYYLSNVALLKADGSSWKAPDSYFLVDHAKPASQHLKLTGVPAGSYDRLRLTIGVDSLRNTSGAQTGALDPVLGMHWDWNSGYIFLRLNGTSAQAPGNGGLFYDVAGFRHPQNTIRTITLPMPGGKPLQVRAAAEPELHLKADVLKLFSGRHTIRFATTSAVAGGADAMKLADNYAAGMFRIDHVHE